MSQDTKMLDQETIGNGLWRSEHDEIPLGHCFKDLILRFFNCTSIRPVACLRY